MIARKAEYLPWIRAALTEQAVTEYMQHVLDPEKSKVIRYELPAMHAEFHFGKCLRRWWYR